MGDTINVADYVRDADCHRCIATTGEPMHLHFRPEDGGVWTWLEQSHLLAVVFTPDEAREMLNGWKRLLNLIDSGVLTEPEFFIRPHTPETGHHSVLGFGLRNGNMTYWRNGENRIRIEVDRPATAGLIDSWEDVCRRL